MMICRWAIDTDEDFPHDFVHIMIILYIIYSHTRTVPISVEFDALSLRILWSIIIEKENEIFEGYFHERGFSFQFPYIR